VCKYVIVIHVREITNISHPKCEVDTIYANSVLRFYLVL